MKKLLLLLLLVTINVTAQTNPAKFRDGVKTPFIQYENLTTNEKLAIPQVEGTLVYDTDLNRLQIYNGNVWVNFFDNTIDTSDDIIEGFNNNFLTADERAKLLNIDNTTNNTFVGVAAGGGVTAGGVTATGIDAAQNSTGANITATGNGAAQGAQGASITVHGANAGGGAIGTGIVGVGPGASRYARGNDITTVGRGAGGFLSGNTLQTPNSTAIGANTVIDKANQAVIGNSQVTELKIGETLVIDKSQIVTGAEGFLVTKKVGGKTVVEVDSIPNLLPSDNQFTGKNDFTDVLSVSDDGGGKTDVIGRYLIVTAETDIETDHPVIEVWRSKVGGYLLNNEEIGALAFRGLPPYGGVAGAGINAFTDGDWSDTSQGTELRVFTTPNGSIEKQASALFTSSGRLLMQGNVGIGSFDNATYPLTVEADGTGIAHVNSNGDLRVYTQLISDNSRFIMRNSSNENKILLHASGTSYIDGFRLAVGKTSASEVLDVDGFTKANGFKTHNGTNDDILIADGSTFSLSNIISIKTTPTTIISLKTSGINYCNMDNANSNETFALSDTNITGGTAKILINTANEPTVTGATKELGDVFTANTDMYLTIYNNGTNIKYYFSLI